MFNQHSLSISGYHLNGCLGLCPVLALAFSRINNGTQGGFRWWLHCDVNGEQLRVRCMNRVDEWVSSLASFQLTSRIQWNSNHLIAIQFHFQRLAEWNHPLGAVHWNEEVEIPFGLSRIWKRTNSPPRITIHNLQFTMIFLIEESNHSFACIT